MADEQPHDESQQRAGTSKLRRLKYSLGSTSDLTEPETDRETYSTVVCPPTAVGDTILEVQADAITAVVAHIGDTSGGTSGSELQMALWIELPRLLPHQRLLRTPQSHQQSQQSL